SVIAPSSMVTFCTYISLGSTLMDLTSKVLKLAFFAERLYSPGFRLTNAKLPSASETISAETFVPVFVNLTEAPGSAAPLESLTTPRTRPYNSSAWAGHTASRLRSKPRARVAQSRRDTKEPLFRIDFMSETPHPFFFQESF